MVLMPPTVLGISHRSSQWPAPQRSKVLLDPTRIAACDELRVWGAERGPDFRDMKIAELTRYMTTMLGPEDHLHLVSW